MHIKVLKPDHKRRIVVGQHDLDVLWELRQTLKAVWHFLVTTDLQRKHRSLRIEDLLDLAEDGLSFCL